MKTVQMLGRTFGRLTIHKGQLDFRNGHWVFEREFFSQLEQI